MNHIAVKLTRVFFLLLAVTVFDLVAVAQGQIDQTFNAVPSIAADPGGQVVQADGKVIVWGTDLTVNGVAIGQLARLNVDGSLDTPYNYCGCQLTSGVRAILQSDGRLLFSGADASQTARVVRINTDGSFDNAFLTSFPAGNGINPGSAEVLAVQPDGKILVQTIYVFGGLARKVYRLNIDGSMDAGFTVIDLGFGQSFGNYVTATLFLPDGKMMLALTSYGGMVSRGVLNRYNADGTIDNTWVQPSFTLNGSTNLTTIGGLARQSDGSLLVSGRFDSINGLPKPNFVRILDAGNVDASFTAAPFFAGDQIAILPGGKLLVSASGGVGNRLKPYRLNSDGSMDNTFVFDPSLNGLVLDWSIDSNGKIVFFDLPASGPGRFVRLNVNGDIDTAFADPNVGKMSQISSAAAQSDGKALVSGPFTQMNGQIISSFARLNSNGSLDTSFDPGTGFITPPRSLIVQPDGKVLALGDFGSYNGVPRTGFARINADGSLDSVFNPVFNLNPWSMALQPDGKIIAVGNFTNVGGTTRTGIVRFNSDGSQDMTFNPVVGSPAIEKAALQTDGKILICGTFSGVNGFSRINLARLNGDGSLDQTFNAGTISFQRQIVLQPDGKVLVASWQSITRRNADGTADTGFPSLTVSAQSGNDAQINSILLQTNGSIVIGGKFTSVNSSSRNNIARFLPSGILDPTFFGTGSNGEIKTLVAQTGSKIIVGGAFTRFENVLKAGILRIDAPTFHRPAPFDFDGDGRTEISVTRVGALYTWYQLRGATFTYTEVNFGQSGDVVTPADFDGDGKTDIAIFRPSNGQWWYISSIDGIQKASTFEAGDDIPLPADLNGDGKADFVKYRPSTGQWRYLLNGGSTPGSFFFGSPGDKPLIGDYDGDGKSDFGIFRPSTGTFWYAASSQGNAFRAFQWGSAGDVPAVGDYDGDGKTDFAIYRPSNGVWWIFNSSTGTTSNVTWGAAEDRPIPADYDGDGRADTAVFRPSNGTWYLLTSSSGFSGFQWGISTDVPSPGAFVPQ